MYLNVQVNYERAVELDKELRLAGNKKGNPELPSIRVKYNKLWMSKEEIVKDKNADKLLEAVSKIAKRGKDVS